jgi:hypothetical protein
VVVTLPCKPFRQRIVDSVDHARHRAPLPLRPRPRRFVGQIDERQRCDVRGAQDAYPNRSGLVSRHERDANTCPRSVGDTKVGGDSLIKSRCCAGRIAFVGNQCRQSNATRMTRRDLSRRGFVASDTPASRRRRQRVANTTGREHSMGASGNDMGSRERDSEMRGTVLVAHHGRCRAVRQSCPEVGRLTPTEWNIGRRWT